MAILGFALLQHALLDLGPILRAAADTTPQDVPAIAATRTMPTVALTLRPLHNTMNTEFINQLQDLSREYSWHITH